jgi:hypothetical protein
VAQLIEAHLAQSPERMASEEKPGTDEPAPQAAGIGSCVGVDAADAPPPAPGAPQAVQEGKDASVEQAREKAKRQIAEAQLATREAASATAEAAAEAAYPSRPPHRNAPLGLPSGGSSTSTPGGRGAGSPPRTPTRRQLAGLVSPPPPPSEASRDGECSWYIERQAAKVAASWGKDGDDDAALLREHARREQEIWHMQQSVHRHTTLSPKMVKSLVDRLTSPAPLAYTPRTATQDEAEADDAVASSSPSPPPQASGPPRVYTAWLSTRTPEPEPEPEPNRPTLFGPVSEAHFGGVIDAPCSAFTSDCQQFRHPQHLSINTVLGRGRARTWTRPPSGTASTAPAGSSSGVRRPRPEREPAPRGCSPPRTTPRGWRGLEAAAAAAAEAAPAPPRPPRRPA